MRRNPGATAALLQKAGSQLRGEKIEKPEDELNAYISSLTQKTVKSQKAVNFEDLGDSISISSDIEDAPVKKAEPVVSSGSKFLKKKPSVDEASTGPASGVGGAGNKFIKKPQASASSPSPAISQQNRYGGQSMSVGRSSSGGPAGRQSSSALDKVSALTGKIQQRAAARQSYKALESDSDESFSAVRISGAVDLASESQTTESVKVGRDGGKFLKKATPSPANVLAKTPTVQTAGRGRQPTQGDNKQQATPQKKASPFVLKSSQRYSTDVVLTSEEESLQEFVGNLPSSSDSMEKPKANQYKRSPARHTPSPPLKVVKSRQSPSPSRKPSTNDRPGSGQHRSVSPQSKPPVVRRTPSPSPRSPGLRRRSPSPKLMRSYSDDSNIADSLQDEVADEYDLGMNVIMDLDELGAVDDLPEIPSRPETPGSRSDSPGRPSARSTTKKPGKSLLKKGSNSSKADTITDSPFKAKSGKSTEKQTKERNKSPFFSGGGSESPFKASSKEPSVFKVSDRDSLFKASNKENQSPFKKSGSNDSPFRAKSDTSPFRASNEGSLFKASGNDSPFKSTKRGDRDRSSSPFKSSAMRSASPITDYSESKSYSKRKGKKDVKKHGKKAEKKASKTNKKKSKPSNDIFSSFGIQSVDDLFGPQSASGRDSASEYEQVTSQVDDLPSEVSEEIRTERPYSRQSSVRYDDSATEIASEIEEVTVKAPSYTDDFDSISEKIGYSSDRGGRSSVSEVRTRYSGDETVASYTEYSDTESDTETYTRTRSEYSDDRTYSDTPSYTEDFTKSVVPSSISRTDATPRPRSGYVTEGVQTTLDGLHYSWDPHGIGLAYPGAPYGLHFVDPTPIASHVVSADALEAMTAYSPAMLALHDMLRSQLELTKEFVDIQKRMFAERTENIQPRYHYTTLQDTKKYIKKNKKKRLTFKEALRLVDMETAQR